MNKQEIEKAIEELKELHNQYWESRYYTPIELAISALEHQLTNEAEIKRLQDEVESLRNWNACEKEQYSDLLKSDKRRIELEEENEELRKQLTNGWIPVSERLPEEYGTYMVAWRPINMTETDVKAKTRGQTTHFYEILEYDPEDEIGWLETIEQSQGAYEILAWQPLPEPYKEVS